MLIRITRLIKSLVAKYNDLLITKPLRTSVISAGLIYGIGDYISQIILEGKFNPDGSRSFLPEFERSRKMMMVGAIWSGPAALGFYRLVNPWYLRVLKRWFPGFASGSGFGKWRRTYVSILVDNLILFWAIGPIKILITGLIGSKGNVMESLSGVKRKLWPTMIMFWSYAPP